MSFFVILYLIDGGYAGYILSSLFGRVLYTFVLGMLHLLAGAIGSSMNEVNELRQWTSSMNK
jgi:hypothetical protein